MLRWNSWIGDCLESLEQHPLASKHDHRLAAWVRILKITEEVGTSFAFDEPSNMADLSESRVQLTMTALQKSAEAWRRDLLPDICANGTFPTPQSYYSLDNRRRAQATIFPHSTLYS